MAMCAEHRLHMSEKFSSGTKNRKQTNKQIHYRFNLNLGSIDSAHAQKFTWWTTFFEWNEGIPQTTFVQQRWELWFVGSFVNRKWQFKHFKIFEYHVRILCVYLFLA